MDEFLRHISIFIGLDDTDLECVAEAAVEKHYPKNSTIIHKDDPGTSMFIVQSGAVNVTTESPHGREVHLATIRTGEFFGEMALFDGKPRSATVVAHEDATVIEISRESFLKLVFRRPDVALKIMAEIATRVRQTDEIVKEYSDKIYREVYTSIDKVLRTELDSAKTIYGNIETSARKTVEHVEHSWKWLTRIILIIIGVFSAIGSVLAFFGYQGYQDIKDKTAHAERHVAKIVQLSKIADENKLLREVMIELRKAHEDFSLEKDLDAMDLEGLRAGAVHYQPTRKALLRYIVHPERYEPEAVVEAVDILLRLARHDKMPLNQEVRFQLHEALLHVAMKTAEDWRVRGRVRELLMAFGELVKDRHFLEQTVVREWRNLIADANLDGRVREEAAIIAASLGATGEDINQVLVETIRDPKHMNFWRRFNASTALIIMGNDEGLRHLVSKTERRNREGLWADLSLARLGRTTLARLSQETHYGTDLAPDVLSRRIQEKVYYISHNTPDELNAFEGAYASKLATCLIENSQDCL
jgi:CRP-like cAMP-binding protein